eukprot:693790-Karenia_brevis.AAC.1
MAPVMSRLPLTGRSSNNADVWMYFLRKALSTLTFLLALAFCTFMSTIRQGLSPAFLISQMPM